MIMKWSRFRARNRLNATIIAAIIPRLEMAAPVSGDVKKPAMSADTMSGNPSKVRTEIARMILTNVKIPPECIARWIV